MNVIKVWMFILSNSQFEKKWLWISQNHVSKKTKHIFLFYNERYNLNLSKMIFGYAVLY